MYYILLNIVQKNIEHTYIVEKNIGNNKVEKNIAE